MVGHEEEASSESQFSHIIQELKRERDELNVSAHLAKAEIRDQWLELEKKWEHFKVKSERVGDVAHESSKEIGESAKMLAEDIREGYRKIKKALQ